MNQFRDLAMAGLIVLALGVELTDPHDWGWAAAGGAYLVTAVDFLGDFKPWTPVVLLALALALFMTRLKY